MNNSTGNLTDNSHTKFQVSIFPFLQKWYHAYLWRAYAKAEVSLQIGYFLMFQPHPAQERMSPHPNKNIMTLTLTFMPQIKTYSLGQLYTLQFCTNAIAVCLSANKTLIVCKALKVTIHTRIITPCQTYGHVNRLSGALQFFPCSFSYFSFPSNRL